jgi:primosomal protein N''
MRMAFRSRLWTAKRLMAQIDAIHTNGTARTIRVNALMASE